MGDKKGNIVHIHNWHNSRRDPDLLDFLDYSVKICFEKQAVPKLEAIWKQSKEQVIVSGATKKFLTWIAKHDFPVAPSAEHDERLEAAKNDELVCGLVEIMGARSDRSAAFASWICDASPYKLFHQPALFAEHSPGEQWSAKIIDAHMSHLFDEAENSSRVLKTVSAPVSNFIKNIAFKDCINIESTLKNSDEIDWSVLHEFSPMVLIDFATTEPQEYPYGCNAKVIFDALPYLPSEYVNWLIRRINFEPGFDKVDGAEEFISTLLSLPVTPPSVWHALNKVVPKTASFEVFTSRLNHLSQIPILDMDAFCSQSNGLLFFDGGEYGAAAGIALDHQFDEVDGGLLTPQKLEELVQHKIDQLVQLRRKNGNTSVVTMDNLSILGGAIESLENDIGLSFNHDLSYLIAYHQHPEDLPGMGYNHSAFSSIFLEKVDLGRRSSQFIRIFHAAMREGWPELATATLTYYFFSQPLFVLASSEKDPPSLMCDWSEMTPCIRATSFLPGFHVLRGEIELCSMLMKQDGRFNRIDIHGLSPWIAESDSLKHPGIREKRKIHEGRIIGTAGIEHWFKLPLQAKSILIDAEMLWDDLHCDHGHGARSFAPMVTEYGKVIEDLVRNGFREISSTDAFHAFYKMKRSVEKVPQHVDVGFFTNNLMKQYQGLPENLQALILQSGITIQDDKKTVRTVMNILDLRNAASHPSPGFFEEEVVTIRNFLFKNGGLRSLIRGFYHMT